MAKQQQKKKGEGFGDLCVKSKVKEAIKASEMNCAGDVFDALGGVVHWYIEQAVGRAKANGRKTVKGHDVITM